MTGPTRTAPATPATVGVDAEADLGGRRVAGASGLVAQANAAGLLDAADVHVAMRLARMCGEHVSDTACLAAAFAVRAVRLGSTCLAVDDLDTAVPEQADGEPEAELTATFVVPAPADLAAALQSSPLVRGAAGGPLQPLVVADSADGPLIYLQKYFAQEQTIRTVLAQRAQSSPDTPVADITAAVDAVFGATMDVPPAQRLATAVAAARWTTILTGGPGTGKTYTVARILAVLERLQSARLHIAVCAPTGRAVAQLQASLDGMRAGLDPDPTIGAAAPVHAVTVHGLLGWRPGSRPRYGRRNRLPHDVVVVDETSMLSVTAMSHLLEAMRPDARLVLVGDPHQLASVEAGAVLADLVERDNSGSAVDPVLTALADESAIAPEQRARLADGIVELTRNFRNRGGIAAVAAAVNAGDADRVLDLVASGDCDDVSLVDMQDGAIADDVVAWGTNLVSAARAGDAVGALRILDAHRVLCAHREGRWGVAGWTRQIAEWLADVPGYPPLYAGADMTVAGVPILVTANDRQNNVFNGDCGVVVWGSADGNGGSAGITEGAGSEVSVAFRRSEFSHPVYVSPTRLPETMLAYAMTIHRSQGSQFDAVTVVLPPADSPLLTRELLYTAITRAKTRVRIVGTPETLRAAVGRRVHRASGLRSEITLTS